MIDGGNIANGWHEAAPPPEPAVAVNSRQLASAASHELHDSQDICPFLPRSGCGAKRGRRGGQGLRVRGLSQSNGEINFRPGFSWYVRLPGRPRSGNNLIPGFEQASSSGGGAGGRRELIC